MEPPYPPLSVCKWGNMQVVSRQCLRESRRHAFVVKSSLTQIDPDRSMGNGRNLYHKKGLLYHRRLVEKVLDKDCPG